MARRELIQYIDDLDGSTLNESDHRVVRFSFDGKNYVMDLSMTNAEKLEEVLSPYIAKASIDYQNTSLTRRRSTNNPNAAHSRERNRKVRQWARSQGIDVADRGALPKAIIEQYNAAHP